MDPHLSTAIIKDTLELINQYNSSEAFRASFKRLFDHPKVVYRGRPLKLYIKVISYSARAARNYLTSTDVLFYQNLSKLHLTPETADELFRKVAQDRLVYRELSQAVLTPQHLFSHEDQLGLDLIEGSLGGAEKVGMFDRFADKQEPLESWAVVGGEGSAAPTSTATVPAVDKASFGYLKRLGARIPILESRILLHGFPTKDKKIFGVEFRGIAPLRALRIYQVRIQQFIARLKRNINAKIIGKVYSIAPPLQTIRYYQLKTQNTINKVKNKLNYTFVRRFFTARLLLSFGGGLLGGFLGGPLGALAGAGAGWFGPTFLRAGAGPWILRGVGFLMGDVSGLLLGVGRLAVTAALAFPVVTLIVVTVIVVAVVVIVFVIPSLTPTPVEAGFLGLNSSCKFTRSGAANPIKSSKLIALFQEVASKSGVPAPVLASVAMHEQPNFVITADDNHDAFGNTGITNAVGCTHFGLIGSGLGSSTTGALGLMQVQPPKAIQDQISAATAGKVPPFDGLNAYSEPGVTLGASLVGKTPDQLTLQDFCDVRTSIYLGAGVLLSKNSGQPPTTSREVRDSVCRYFGGNPNSPNYCKYPSPPDTSAYQYNYGEEARADFNNCQVFSYSAANAPPADADFQKLHDNILTQFKINFNSSFSYNYLKWAWEKLWQASNTNFSRLINPNNVVISVNPIGDDSSLNEQTGPSSISMRLRSRSTKQPYPEQLFKIIFIHELGHIIEQNNASKKSELQNIISQEGSITNFSGHSDVCVGDINLNEDFAETFAYYLNPDIPEQSLGIGPQCEPPLPAVPPFQRNKPLHQKFAADLLGVGTPVTLQSTSTYPQFSCPVVGSGKTILASYQQDPINGHCGEKYVANGEACINTDSRRARSIDIETCLNPRPDCQIDSCQPLTDEQKATYQCGQTGKDVILPSIEGQTNLLWKRLDDIPLSSEDCFNYEIVDPNGLGGGCGVGYVFQADLGGGKNWVMHLLHMGPTQLQIGQAYPPGTIVGKTTPIHVHISIGKDIQQPYSQNEAGWLSADKELHLCQ